MEPTVEYGFEADRLASSPRDRMARIRWWLYVEVPEEVARPQAPRRGVTGDGFQFARGGRVHDPDHARTAIQAAVEEARREWAFWTHQPSHALGPDGELVPLDRVAPELPT